MKKRIVILFLLFFVSGIALGADDDAEQQFVEFNLSGVSSEGDKTWNLTGESADIFGDVVKLTNIVANVYGEENMKLTANEGELNKSDGNLLLQDEVIATTDDGARMTTDSLTWDRDKSLITTEDFVTVEKDNLVATGTGIEAQTQLKQTQMKKDVTVEFNSVDKENKKRKTVVTCDGPLEIDYQKKIAEFNNNVVVTDDEGTMNADYMKLFISFETKELDRIIARGNVKIQRAENTSYSDEAEYIAGEQRIILSGQPKIIFYTEEDDTNAPFGD
ncbi:LPS export ABC transporter periplasmic protein LptC [Candidatus Omnitrophota bacterium]